MEPLNDPQETGRDSGRFNPVAWCRLDNWGSGGWWPDDCFSSVPLEGWTPLYTADRIEALERENARLREALNTLAELAANSRVRGDGLIGADTIINLARAALAQPEEKT